MESFLAYLARQYRHKAEDIATDTMLYLLRYFDPANAAFRSLLGELGHTIPEDYRLESRTGGKNGIPDLCILNSDGLCLGIVENKFWARLTRHQPSGYFEYLREDGGFIIFIVPEARRNDLEDKLDRQRATWPREHDVRTISWDRVLEVVGKSISTSQPMNAPSRGLSAPEAFMFFDQLRRSCDVEIKERVKPLDSSDLDNRHLGQRVLDYVSLTKSLIQDQEIEEIFHRTKNQNDSDGPGWSGYYGKLAGIRAWIGFDAGLWSKYGLSPIWLTFEQPDEALRKLFAEWLEGRRAFADPGKERLDLPILLRPGVEQDEVIESALSQLKAIHAMFPD